MLHPWPKFSHFHADCILIFESLCNASVSFLVPNLGKLKITINLNLAEADPGLSRVGRQSQGVGCYTIIHPHSLKNSMTIII